MPYSYNQEYPKWGEDKRFVSERGKELSAQLQEEESSTRFCNECFPSVWIPFRDWLGDYSKNPY